MTQITTACGWDLQVERGPDWLFVRPTCAAEDAAPIERADLANLTEGIWADLAEEIWNVYEQSFSRRLVLELDAISHLNSTIIGQLVLLHKRVHSHDGIVRICGLSNRNQEVLHIVRLDSRFPLYRDREEAVRGCQRVAPR